MWPNFSKPAMSRDISYWKISVFWLIKHLKNILTRWKFNFKMALFPLCLPSISILLDADRVWGNGAAHWSWILSVAISFYYEIFYVSYIYRKYKEIKSMQVKVARYKKHLCIILNIQQNLNFPAQTENQAFVLVFVRKKIELHNTKLTPSDSKTEKASS